MPANTKPSIHERLAAILDELPAIGKDAFNPGLKFNFRSIEQILNELNPLLGKHGVFILPEAGEIRMSTRPTRNGEASVAIVTVTYRFTADDGTFVEATSVGEGQDSGDKAVSKAMTMALKTCLGQMFAISTEEDPDGESVAPSSGPPLARARGAAKAAKAATPAPPSPLAAEAPVDAPRSLDDRRQWCFLTAKELPPATLVDLKKEMAENGIGMDFGTHTEEQVAWLEDKLSPF